MPDYSLTLSTPKHLGKKPVMNITALAEDWTRSIRLRGGYWNGNFLLHGSIDELRMWYFNFLGFHIEERSPHVTWEGYIDEMQLDSSGVSPILDVSVNGYIFKAYDRYVPHTIQAGRYDVPINDWFGQLIDSCDQEYLDRGSLQANTVEVKRVADPQSTIGSDFERLAKMGDADRNYFVFSCGNDGRVSYQQLNLDPIYFVYSGMRRSRSYGDMYNWYNGMFTTEQGNTYWVDGTNEAGSVELFGRREKTVSSSDTGIDIFDWLDVQLMESAWPYSRPLAISGNMLVKDQSGRDMSRCRWSLRPGVVRDMSGIVAANHSRIYGNPYLTDRRDMVVDQVRVGIGEISFERGDISNLEMLESLWDWKRRKWQRHKAKVRDMYMARSGVPAGVFAYAGITPQRSNRGIMFPYVRFFTGWGSWAEGGGGLNKG